MITGVSVVQVHEATSAHRPDSLATSSISDRQELLEQGYAEDFIADETGTGENVEGAQEALEINDSDPSIEQNGFRKTAAHQKSKTSPNVDSRHFDTIQTIPNPEFGAAKTFEQLTREKLLGNVTNFEDIDVSSEESVNASYGSRFKVWPKPEQFSQQGAVGSDHSTNSVSETEGPPVKIESIKEPSDIVTKLRADSEPRCDSSFKTFKTRAMLPHPEESGASLNDDIAYPHTENHRTDLTKAYQTVSKDLRDSLGDDGEATFKLASNLEKVGDVRSKIVVHQNVDSNDVS